MTSSNAITSRRFRHFSLLALTTAGLMAGGLSLPMRVQAKEIRLLVQLNNYEGENAYFALYLINPEGRYAQTLWVSGDEEKYFPDLPRWWKYLSRAPQGLDAITGASTAGGDRNILKLEIADEFINTGFKLRVETAVEEHENYDVDVEFDLSEDTAGQKIPGTGYVRFINFKL